jgi:DNA invertase Pin-like site-specific DNA recombinase
MMTHIPTKPPEPVRAAQYLRMSTDGQQYSMANQAAAISLYAAAHGFIIVRSYLDSGKSGITIKSRASLQDLIRTVQSGQADFDCILVYDVSRWGRFQDLDEPAHYEYLCRSAGINVHYCAEQFANDNSMLNGFLKVMKRMMAGDFSRQLSFRVSAGQARCVQMGYKQGSSAPYGLRRMLVDAQGNRKHILSAKEQKALATDRVIFVPGPPEETLIVKEVFNRCTQRGQSSIEIARALTQDGISAPSGRSWTEDTVKRLISNEKYMGVYIFGRSSRKLRTRRIRNDPKNWTVKRDAIEPIISAVQFEQAQRCMEAFRRYYSRERLLQNLRQLLKKHGRLSLRIINAQKGTPRASSYLRRFGSLRAAFSLVGFDVPVHFARRFELKEKLRAFRLGLQQNLIGQIQQRGVDVSVRNKPDMLTLNQELKIGLRVMHKKPHKHTPSKRGWLFDVNFHSGVDILICACLDGANERVEAQYIIPKWSRLQGRYWCGCGNGTVLLEACRSDTLQPLLDAVSRVPIHISTVP